MTAPKFVITKYTHHFVVEKCDTSVKELCQAFSRPLIAWTFKVEYGISKRVAFKVYAASNAPREYFRFHINLFDAFVAFLEERGITDKLYHVIDASSYVPVHCDIDVREGWVSKEDQVEHIDYLVNSRHPSRLLTRQTGTGKTYCALAAVARIKHRVAIVVKPMYMKKWYSDVKQILQVTDDDIVTVAGSEQLKMLIMKARLGELTEKIVLISLTTMDNWITAVEDTGYHTREDGFECWPWEFFETIGAGVRIVDEVHQSFHQIFKMDLYTNVPISVSLSATLISRDALTTRMYDVMFPPTQRAKELELNKYAHTSAIHFNFERPEHIRTSSRGRTTYSHVEVEKSIMKHVPTMLKYFRLIHDVVDRTYAAHPRKKKRLLIFASTIQMCTKLVTFLKSKYPHMDVRRYCEGDPYENVIDPDIRVSTIGSCGAAIDIPDLTTVINTHNIDSIQANIQALGRLRPLKGGSNDAENAVHYYWLTADNIPKHQVYAVTRKALFTERAASVASVNSGAMV